MAKPKKQAGDKPISQHEPSPEELDQAVKVENINAADLLAGLLRRGVIGERG